MKPSLAALRLLIVDDNEQMRTIIGAVLAAAGVRHNFFGPDRRRKATAGATGPRRRASDRHAVFEL